MSNPDQRTITGVLVDVSGSMKRVNVENKSWARSIFKVVDELIKHDVASSNHVFALGFGACRKSGVFDLLNTLKTMQRFDDIDVSGTKREMLEEAMNICRRYGAPRVHKWTDVDMLMKVVEENQAATILKFLKGDPEFRRRFIYRCLPEECRTVVSYGTEFALGTASRVSDGSSLFSVFSFIPGVSALVDDVNSRGTSTTKDSVQRAVNKGMDLIAELYQVNVSKNSVMNVHEASKILHGSLDKDELTDKRVDELLKSVEPFIYGGTPLIRSLNDAVNLFSEPMYGNHHKVLFVMSGEDPTDDGDPPVSRLSQLGVHVAGCFATNEHIDNPRHLYSTECANWEYGAKFMFRISSVVTTQKIPRTIFVKKGWTVDFTNNETRLFCKVNHPDILKEVCDLARDVVCSQDTLSDVLSSVSLELYINQANDGFPAPHQGNTDTCYANAIASVMHLAMHRIVGREGGYPDFLDLRRELLGKYGQDGADTTKVLQQMCPQHRLRCKIDVDIQEALKAIVARCPVVARFKLTEIEMKRFYWWFKDHPYSVLRETDIGIDRRQAGDKVDQGHAVVLTGFNSKGLRFMNSYGSNGGTVVSSWLRMLMFLDSHLSKYFGRKKIYFLQRKKLINVMELRKRMI